jgi:hypothetical protein
MPQKVSDILTGCFVIVALVATCVGIVAYYVSHTL